MQCLQIVVAVKALALMVARRRPCRRLDGQCLGNAVIADILNYNRLNLNRVKYSVVNGAKVAYYPMEGVRSIVVKVMLKAGSWYESGQNWGNFHLMEHLLFQGTERFPSKEKLDVFRYEHGITVDASTGGESMMVVFKFPAVELTAGMEFVEQFLFHNLIKVDRLENEIKVISQEYSDKWSRPLVRFERALSEQLYGKEHLFTRDGMGNIEFIKKSNSEQLRNLYKQFFQPRSMVITLVGGFEQTVMEKTMISLLESRVNSEMPGLVLPAINPTSRELWLKDKVDQTYLSWQWVLPAPEAYISVRRLAIGLGNFMLGGSSNSFLFQKLRSQNGLVYHVSSSYTSYPLLSLITISLSVRSELKVKAIEAVRSAVEAYRSTKVDDGQLQRNKKHIDYQLLMSFDSIGVIADSLTKDLFYEDKIYLPEDKIEIRKKITPELIEESMFAYLKMSDAYMGVLEPIS